MISVKISFGIIVLNGEPFTRYNLRSIYPWAHQIIVVEGACTSAKFVSDSKGHSRDSTLDVLRRFQADEDHEKKLIIITAEDEGHPDGFWPGEKDEMSKAYAKRATGNFLWQVDVDEFYHENDMVEIIRYLEHSSDTLSFPAFHFWGGIEFIEDGEFMRVHKGREVNRIFRWGEGYSYATHRPTTILDENGLNLRSLNWIKADDLEKKNIFLYHYSMLLPKQVAEKCSYYKNVDWASFQYIEEWSQQTFKQLNNLFSVCHTHQVPLSWLDEYKGHHPRQVLKMISKIRLGLHHNIELRSTQEIFNIIRTPQYRIGRLIRKAWVKIIPGIEMTSSFITDVAKITPLYSLLRRNKFLRSNSFINRFF